MIPTLARRAKTRHPTQKPTKASSEAAPKSIAVSTQAAACSEHPNHRISADKENASPIAWANRLGGPATRRGAPMRGAATRVANCPSGLSFGPESTRAAKP
jgi:hypothetical protein